MPAARLCRRPSLFVVIFGPFLRSSLPPLVRSLPIPLFNLPILLSASSLCCPLPDGSLHHFLSLHLSPSFSLASSLVPHCSLLPSYFLSVSLPHFSLASFSLRSIIFPPRHCSPSLSRLQYHPCLSFLYHSPCPPPYIFFLHLLSGFYRRLFRSVRDFLLFFPLLFPLGHFQKVPRPSSKYSVGLRLSSFRDAFLSPYPIVFLLLSSFPHTTCPNARPSYPTPLSPPPSPLTLPSLPLPPTVPCLISPSPLPKYLYLLSPLPFSHLLPSSPPFFPPHFSPSSPSHFLLPSSSFYPLFSLSHFHISSIPPLLPSTAHSSPISSRFPSLLFSLPFIRFSSYPLPSSRSFLRLLLQRHPAPYSHSLRQLKPLPPLHSHP
ncbi:hypothetical protein C7M84_015780, partial [Penaeus vannamei]